MKDCEFIAELKGFQSYLSLALPAKEDGESDGVVTPNVQQGSVSGGYARLSLVRMNLPGKQTTIDLLSEVYRSSCYVVFFFIIKRSKKF